LIWNASPTIENSFIHHSGTGIHLQTSSLPTLTNNSKTDNTAYDIHNESPQVDVDATNNWWGYASGPFHPTLNPNGEGNQVSDHVLFDPWLQQAPDPLVTAVEKPFHRGDPIGDELPTDFDLHPGYPNPFNPVTTIEYDVAAQSFVSIQVVDALGRVVATLVDREMAPGHYSAKWNAERVPSGIYIVRLTTGEIMRSQTIVLLK